MCPTWSRGRGDVEQGRILLVYGQSPYVALREPLVGRGPTIPEVLALGEPAARGLVNGVRGSSVRA